jgi:1-acyl-sn-glycerol-3-phosphate acyltransferase
MRWLLIDVLLTLHTFFFSLFIACLALLAPRTGAAEWASCLWGKGMLYIAGVRYLPPIRKIPGQGPYVLMSNHQSNLDPALLWQLPLRLRFVYKIELLFVPVLGLALWAMGNITVNRQNHKKAVQSLQRAAKKIRAGTNVLMFPEGTRNSDPGAPLLPFKKGGFMLAIEAGVPILPIGIAGTGECLRKGSPRTHAGLVAYEIGEPIPTAGLTAADRDALMEKVRQAIEQLCAEARERLLQQKKGEAQ